jgi:hypothetical protein
MIVCPACQHRNPEQASRCEACGGSLEHFIYRACPACGALNEASSAFCQRCLEPLLPQFQALAGASEEDLVRPFVPGVAEEAPVSTARHRRAAVQRAEPKAEPPAGAEAEAPAAPPEPALRQEAPEESPGQEPAAEPVPATVAQAMPDPLAGLEHPLPGAAAIATLPHREAPGEAEGPSEADHLNAALLRRIAAERPSLREAVRVVVPRQAKALPRLGRVMLYLLLLLVALAPALTGGQTASLVQPREAVVALARTVEALPRGAKVLLSFDYGPGYAGELDPLALALMRHLARRGAQVAAMSLTPQGVGQAQWVLGHMPEEWPRSLYGENWIILGYLPGQEAGLRALGTGLEQAFRADALQERPLSAWPLGQGLTTLRDFDQVIVLADDAQTVRRWIEQVGGRHNVPLHALVTAAVEPLLVPYRQTGQLATLINGAAGAAEYESAIGARPDALAQTDGYALLFVLVLGMAIITNAIYVSQGPEQRPRSRRPLGNSR